MNELIQVTKSTLPSLEEYIDEIKDLWESHWVTNSGDKYIKLVSKLKKHLKTENISLYTNGHLALEYSIKTFDITGEVITTPFTFASTTHAIVRNGVKPVFCDINPGDYTIDVEKIESLITEKTSAIIPVHVYGNVCDVEAIDKIAKKYNLKVIYDAAHAFGVEVDGKGIGSFGDASMFSFHATKVFNTIEGGALTYNDSKLNAKLESLKNFGIVDSETISYIGGNAKMNEFQAAMGICNLRNINSHIDKRKSIVERYKSHLSDIEGIQLLPKQKMVKSNYAYFPVLFNDFKLTRNEVATLLEKHNIHARKYFYPLTSRLDCYSGLYEEYPTPVAKYVSEHILTLPLYPELTFDDVDRICAIIKG